MADRLSAQTTKIDRYGWTIKDKPGIFMMIPKHELQVNSDYQRTLLPAKVAKMSSSWSWVACGVISVALRANAFWVIDGQHRLMAAMRRADITDLPCIVYESDDVQEEATGFLNINTARRPMSAVDQLRAATVAGDPAAQQFTALCERLGLRIVSNGKAPHTIRAAAWGREHIVKDPAATAIVVELAAELATADGIPVQERLLDGLWHIHQHGNVNLLDSRLRQRIKLRGAKELFEAAGRASALYNQGGPRIFAIGMLTAINKNLQVKFTLRNMEQTDHG